MPRKTALLLDTHNIYMGINKKFPGKVLNYVGLLNILQQDDFELFHKVSYGRQQEDPKVKPFSTMLRKNGFDVHFGDVPHNIQMAVKAVDIINNSNIEVLILGTNYYEVQHIFRYAREKGVSTLCLGVNIPEFFNQFSTVWEIVEEMCQDRKPKIEEAQAEIVQ